MVANALDSELDSIVDPQRQKEYEWEWSFRSSYGQEFRSLVPVRRLIKAACELYGVPAPVVVAQPRKRGFSVYRPLDHRILLLKGHWAVWPALHEAAHAICAYKWDIVGHGPKFLGVLMWLLSHFDVAPVAALTASAKAAKLKFTQVGRAAPSQSKQSKRKAKQSKRK